MKSKKPVELNGDHGHIWDKMHRLENRVDLLFVVIFAFMGTILGVVLTK